MSHYPRSVIPKPIADVWCERCKCIHPVLPPDFSIQDHAMTNAVADIADAEEALWLEISRKAYEQT